MRLDGKVRLITLSGKINSGKDEVCDMIRYIINTHTFGNKNIDAKYEFYKESKDIISDPDYNICGTFSFGENLKKTLSLIFGIPIELFNNRDYKDKYLYVPVTNKFIDINKYSEPNKLEHIDDNDYFKVIPNITRYTTIRELMQKFSEHTKELFGKDIWGESLCRKLSYYYNDTNCYDFLIITDLRFISEFKTIDTFEPITIYIDRPNNNITSEHISEVDIKYSGFKFNYIINNNGTLEDLFNNVKLIMTDIICK